MFKFLFGSKPQLEDLNKFDCVEALELESFYEINKMRSHVFKSETLSWYDSNTEGKTILLLPGTTGNADVWYSYYMELSKNYRVLVPNLPELETLNDLCDLITEWMDYLKLDQVTMMGQSFGGVIAQVYSDKNPNRIAKLVLLTSFANTEAVKDKTRKGYQKSLNRFTDALKNLKFESLQKSIYKQVVKGVDVAFVDNKPFWKAFYGNILLESRPEFLKAIHELQLNYWTNVQSGLAKFEGAVLLVEATTDATYDREEKKALVNRYPTADVFNIEGSSNLSHIRDAERILESIKTFI